ncbi:DUF5671 domain-containing protein [Paracoccus amoyensis]|nr:DUF5671 domain-containing protein [Paracoccus amoyensis]
MLQAGWSAKEVAAALDGWADAGNGMPPVPRPGSVIRARSVVSYGLLFISLAMVAWHIVWLGFGIIEAIIPDLSDFGATPHAMRWSIAMLIVFVPLFLLLDRRRDVHLGKEHVRRALPERRWFASVSLLVASLVLIGDLVASVYALLTGDLTIRFAAKAFLVAGVGALVMIYYRGDMNV